MRTIPLSDLRERAKSRPPGYTEDVLANASAVTATHYTLSDEAFASLAAKYRRSAPIVATKPGEWPAAARWLMKRKREGERGIGDTFARIVGPIGGDAFKHWTKWLGFNCGCSNRQAALNARFPYA